MNTTNPTREAQPSATPRTDAAQEWHDCNNKRCGFYVYIDVAKGLERELQQANARERDLKDELANTEHKNQAQGMEIAALASELSETRAELARLKAGSGDTRLLEAQQLLRDLILQHRSVGTKLATQDVDDIEIVLDALRLNQAESARLAAELNMAKLAISNDKRGLWKIEEADGLRTFETPSGAKVAVAHGKDGAAIRADNNGQTTLVSFSHEAMAGIISSYQAMRSGGEGAV